MTPEQQRFEAWFSRRHSQYTWGLCKAPNGDYIYLHVELAWQAWQEALASHAPIARGQGYTVSLGGIGKACELSTPDDPGYVPDKSNEAATQPIDDSIDWPKPKVVARVIKAEIEHNDH